MVIFRSCIRRQIVLRVEGIQDFIVVKEGRQSDPLYYTDCLRCEEARFRIFGRIRITLEGGANDASY